MFKVSHSFLISIAGMIWLTVGCFLLPLGLNLVIAAILKDNAMVALPVLSFFSPYVGGLEQAALVWISIMLLVGFFKGRFVFIKSVNRSVYRILSLPNPVSVTKIYPPAYYLLLLVMVLLGVLIRFLPIDVRGGIDIAVGAALINGAMAYFRKAWSTRKISC
jgi:hypothetical protein